MIFFVSKNRSNKCLVGLDSYMPLLLWEFYITRAVTRPPTNEKLHNCRILRRTRFALLAQRSTFELKTFSDRHNSGNSSNNLFWGGLKVSRK